MRPVNIDYISAWTPPTFQGFLCLVGGVALMWLLGESYWGLRDDIERHTEQLMTVQQLASRQAEGKSKSAVDTKQLTSEMKEADDVLTRLTVQWDGLFRTVEVITSKHSAGITVRGVHPDVEGKRVSIKGDAKDFNVLVDYIEQLSQDEIMSRVYLVNHRLVPGDGLNRIEFSAVAEWRPQL